MRERRAEYRKLWLAQLSPSAQIPEIGPPPPLSFSYTSEVIGSMWLGYCSVYMMLCTGTRLGPSFKIYLVYSKGSLIIWDIQYIYCTFYFDGWDCSKGAYSFLLQSLEWRQVIHCILRWIFQQQVVALPKCIKTKCFLCNTYFDKKLKNMVDQCMSKLSCNSLFSLRRGSNCSKILAHLFPAFVMELGRKKR